MNSPRSNASFAGTESTKDFHSPTHCQNSTASWQNHILKTKTKPQTPSNWPIHRSDRHSYQLPKTTTNCDQDRTTFSSIKIALPPFPYPKVKTQDMSTTSQNSTKFDATNTNPSTLGSIIDDLSSRGAKCNLSWNDDELWN